MNTCFGRVQINNFMVTTDIETFLPTLILAEGTTPHHYREFYVHSGIATGAHVWEWLLYAIDPIDETPEFCLFTLIGAHIIFKNQLFLSVGDAELPLKNIHFLSDEERARFAQLTPPQ